MTGLLDALYIEFGLDASKFTKGQKEVVDGLAKIEKAYQQTQKKLQEATNKSADAIVALTRNLMGLFGLAAANRLSGFIADLANSAAAVGRLSENIGTSNKDLEAWGILSERYGGTKQEAETSIAELQRKFFLLRNRDPHALSDGMWQALGRAGGGIAGRLRDETDPSKQMELIGQAVDNIHRNEGRDNAFRFGQDMGIPSGALNRILDKGWEAARKEMEKIKEDGLTATKEQIEAAERLQHAFAVLLQTLVKFQRAFLTVFGEPIFRVLERIVGILRLLGGDSVSDVQKDMNTSLFPNLPTVQQQAEDLRRRLGGKGGGASAPPTPHATAPTGADGGGTSGPTAPAGSGEPAQATTPPAKAAEAERPGWFRRQWNWLTGQEDTAPTTAPTAPTGTSGAATGPTAPTGTAGTAQFPTANGVNTRNVDPELVARMNAMYRDAPEAVKRQAYASSGWRSYEQQADAWRRSNGGRNFMAARPGHSQHERLPGRAIDWVDPTGWSYRNSERYGLYRPYGARDSVHMQMDPSYRGHNFYDPTGSSGASANYFRDLSTHSNWSNLQHARAMAYGAVLSAKTTDFGSGTVNHHNEMHVLNAEIKTAAQPEHLMHGMREYMKHRMHHKQCQPGAQNGCF